MRGRNYQIMVISLGVLSTLLFGVFLYREVFPEYKIYQDDYIALEKFRSTYTGEEPPPFKTGIKQIVMEQDDKGPAAIDRCVSCHVALQFEHFSPTTIARDINGDMELDADGFPVQIANPNYIWSKLDQAIADLRNPGTISKLTPGEATLRLKQANEYEALKTAHVDGHIFDVTKVLRMHPLMGRETRPFEFHPIEEYGCVSCHNGNGRGLTTEKAHGPVFDGHYEAEVHADTPIFIEGDPANDPQFSRIFNHKPGHDLLFQTTPIFVGKLIQARCVQCHKTGTELLQSAASEAALAKDRRQSRSDAVIKSLDTEEKAVASLLLLKQRLIQEGIDKTLTTLQQQSQDYTRAPADLDALDAQITYIKKHSTLGDQALVELIDQQLISALGTKQLADNLQSAYDQSPDLQTIRSFVSKNQGTGTLFAKVAAANLETELLQHVRDTESSLQTAANDPLSLNAISSDIDQLTSTFHEGQNLYISQACYACHRIAGLARGGVGPELTREGLKYPWFIKESITWPQADLKTSTMPNYKLDHQDVEALMTFMLGQTGQRKHESDAGRKAALQEWEAGKKLPWEKEVSPALMHDLDFGMTTFATQGCAACHRLKGFQSDTGFAVEKEKDVPFDTLYREQQWFAKLFPEEAPGTQIVHALEHNKEEIDRRIVSGVRVDSLLERIEKDYPYAIESLYSNFRYASRAKNQYYADQISQASAPAERNRLKNEQNEWKERVRRVLMMYVQQYGLGRLVGPRPNWSGVYRTDEWLMEHFKQPTAHVPRSIMPVLPFDESKFYALTYMLDVLGAKNRDAVKKIWTLEGFSPQLAYDIYCAQCHGEHMQGDGPVSAWIYPVPKNLQNAEFMRNMTKDRIQEAIVHGVKGGPMPPWGEAPVKPSNPQSIPVLTAEQINLLTDWLFSTLPGGTIIRKNEDVPKWQYSPQDAIEEMQREGSVLDSDETYETPQETRENEKAISPSLTYASLNPTVTISSTDKYFDIKENPIPGGNDKHGYYIKKKYYTPQNLAEGKAYFDLNCAACHGRDADGSGNRATAMIEAKPRMLTNIDWQNSRDDLRWIRSIKYGVPGTSMQAWGDQTSAKQRMQLVMYIRSMTEDVQERAALYQALYNTFNTATIAVENARIADAPAIAAVQKELDKAQQSQAALHNKANIGQSTPDEAVAAYRSVLDLTKQLQHYESIDNTLASLLNEIQADRLLYEEIGLGILGQKNQGINIAPFLSMIEKESGRYTWNGSTLTFTPDGKTDDIQKQILDTLEKRLDQLKAQKREIEGRIASPQRAEDLTQLNLSINGLGKLKNKIIGNLEAAKRSEKRQTELLDRYNELKK